MASSEDSVVDWAPVFVVDDVGQEGRIVSARWPHELVSASGKDHYTVPCGPKHILHLLEGFTFASRFADASPVHDLASAGGPRGIGRARR